MAKKFLTLLVLPRGRSRFRRVEVSTNFVVSMVLLTGVLLFSAFAAPRLFFAVNSEATENEQLAQENLWLRSEKDQFEKRLAAVSTQLASFEAHADQMAEALGMDELATAGAGGAVEDLVAEGQGAPWDSDLDSLDARAEGLAASMDEISGVVQLKVDRLASTPSVMPADGWFSHGYGWRKDPFHGRRQFHRGVDIVADYGEPVMATANGVVSRVSRQPDYGKVIDISHGHGYVSRYGHLSEILVRAGQRVERGDLIGRVGSTGRSTGPHLHYEIHRDGRRINPWSYLGKKGS